MDRPREWKTIVTMARPAFDAVIWQWGGRAAPRAHDQAQQAQADPEGVHFDCPRCGRAFPTQKALAVHMITAQTHARCHCAC
eukprot:638628-Alexandrium_andersonii.AAC.1